jgi:antitoxin YefM
MELTYHLNANELNEDFINTIKKLYKGKDLEVTVQVKEDETEYLLKSEANREQLLKAVKDVKNKKNLRTLNMAKLNNWVSGLKTI